MHSLSWGRWRDNYEMLVWRDVDGSSLDKAIQDCSRPRHWGWGWGWDWRWDGIGDGDGDGDGPLPYELVLPSGIDA